MQAIKHQILGFYKIQREHIVSAAIVTAHELSKRKKGNLPVYLVGSPGLKQTLEEVGIESFGVGPDPIENYTQVYYFPDYQKNLFQGSTPLMNVDISQPASAVVCSFDIHFNYVKIMKASNYLKDPNVDFIVTNEDYTFPGSIPGVVIPGSGITSAAIKAVTGREPIVMGKPGTAMFNFISSKYHIDPKKTLMIGDRCDTDIWFGNNHGLDTMLVLTGINGIKDLERFASEGKVELIPKMYAPTVKILFEEDEKALGEVLQDGIKCVA